MANQLPGRCIGASAKLKTDLGIFLFDSAYYDNTKKSNSEYLVWGARQEMHNINIIILGLG